MTTNTKTIYVYYTYCKLQSAHMYKLAKHVIHWLKQYVLLPHSFNVKNTKTEIKFHWKVIYSLAHLISATSYEQINQYNK